MAAARGKRAIALVSGGLDSIVSLAVAREKMEVRLVLFFDYGQRALDSERAAAIEAANYYGLPIREVEVDWLGSLAPEGMRYDSAESTKPSLDTLEAVWVPNRNGVFLNAAAAFAESYGCDVVVTGFNREEAEEFPDNSAEYVAQANRALAHSTRNRVEITSFTQSLAKPEIMALGVEIGAPLSVIWSCYHGGQTMCGACGSCKRLRAALAEMPADSRPVIVFGDE